MAELGPWEIPGIASNTFLKREAIAGDRVQVSTPGTGETSQVWLRGSLVRTGVAGCLPGCHFTNKNV